MRPSCPLAIFVVCLALGTARAPADELVIVKPGGEGSTRRAERFVGDLTGYLGARMSVELSGAYYNDLDEALERLRADRPTHGVVGLDFYLAHRREFDLRAVMGTRPGGRGARRYVVVTPEDGAADLEALTGGRLLGRHLAVEAFGRKIVLGGRAPGVELVYEKRTTSALRALASGEAAGLVATEDEWAGIQTSERYGAGLREIHTSEAVPTELVVVFGGVDPVPLVTSLRSMAGDEAGRALLETMGNDGFVDLDAAALERATRLFED